MIVFGFNYKSNAQSKKNLPKIAKIGYIYESYSGATNKSFSEGQPGHGVEISIDDGGEYVRYFANIRLAYSSGKQNFLDNTDVVKSNYTLLHLAPELGFGLYPVARKMSGLNLFIWGSGIIGYSQLELSPISTESVNGSTTAVTEYSKLRRKDQGVGYGYGAGVGLEAFIGGKSKSGRMIIYSNLGFREITSNLASRSDFQINSFAFSIGLGF